MRHQHPGRSQGQRRGGHGKVNVRLKGALTGAPRLHGKCSVKDEAAGTEAATAALDLPVEIPFDIGQTSHFEGKARTVVDARHLGKKIAYNTKIKVNRKGEVNDRTPLVITQDLSDLCDDLPELLNRDGSLNLDNVDIAVMGMVGAKIEGKARCVIHTKGSAKAGSEDIAVPPACVSTHC